MSTIRPEETLDAVITEKDRYIAELETANTRLRDLVDRHAHEIIKQHARAEELDKIAAAYFLEENITEDERMQYIYKLRKIIAHDMSTKDILRSDFAFDWAMAHATPLQRREAWLAWRADNA